MIFIDQLITKIIEKKNPTVVGLDPQVYLIPRCIIEKYSGFENAMGEMIWQFNKAVIDGVGELIPAVKLQIAFYEQWGLEGLEAYQKTIEYAQKKELLVIGDIKRGDISSTAESYAQAHLKGPFSCGAVTINPFLGSDSIHPFLTICQKEGKGVFILVKTSNPSSGEIQNLQVQGKPLYMHVASLVEGLGKELIGEYGYSSVGAVVAATYPGEARRIREKMPQTFFLVPGYGAQRGRVEDIVHAFDERGLGAIVNSSRGILGAYIQEKGKDVSMVEFQNSLIDAVIKMKESIGNTLKESKKYGAYNE